MTKEPPDFLTPPGLPGFLELGGVRTMVDLGCGACDFTSFLIHHSAPDAIAVGVDVDRRSLRRAMNRSGIRLVQGSATLLPLRSDTVDLALCRRLLMNLARPGDALQEMVRIVRPGGTVAAFEPDFLGERGHSTVPGEMDFLRRLLLATSQGSDLGFGPKALSLFVAAGLTDIQTIVHSPVLMSEDGLLPTVHREGGSVGLVQSVRRMKQEAEATVGPAGYAGLLHEAESLDRVREDQLKARSYHAVSTFPLWVVKGHKPSR